MGFFAASVCVRGLGVQDGRVSDSQLSASSSVDGHIAKMGRLIGNSCWMPSGSLQAEGEWLQVNLTKTKRVTGVVIQGCPGQHQRVTSLKLQLSMDAATWINYTAVGPVRPLIPVLVLPPVLHQERRDHIFSVLLYI